MEADTPTGRIRERRLIDLQPAGTRFGSELPQQTVIVTRGRFRLEHSEIYPPSPNSALTQVSHIDLHKPP